MPKKSTRKSVSLSAEMYASIERHCHMRGVSMSSFVTASCTTALTAAGATMVHREEAVKRIHQSAEEREAAVERDIRAAFTF